MNRLTPTLFVWVFLALWTSTESRRGLNPCHRGRSRFTVSAESCETLVLPKSLCRSCRIRAVAPDGAFPDCESIYDINPACETALAEYVDLNSCDDKRKNQVENIDDPDNRRFLDFFIYSVCEECCDCVPFGASPGEYGERKKMGRTALTQLERGNCPVHVRFDVCKIWPNVRDLRLPGETARVGWPIICPIIEDWFQSPLSNGWQTRAVSINRQITRFLRRFNRVAKCRNKRVWEECTALEFAQRRL